MPSADEPAPGDGPGEAAAGAAPPPPEGLVDVQAAAVRKKKKKSKGVTARGPTAMSKSRGTGFEKYYADPPLTPDEHEEETHLYHWSLSFDERIETCIQRYRARRRLDNERTLLFNRYLSIGGIDCEPRQFNGANGMYESEGLSKDDVRVMTATDVVPHAGSAVSKYYASDNAHLWTVDFTGVVSGFLSVSLPAMGSASEKLVSVGIDVVDNFLRYLQIHDVCPEYDDDIRRARTVCARAHTELPNLRRALPHFPGQFNLACVALFCKTPEHTALHDGLNPLDAPLAGWDGGSQEDAARIFRSTAELQSDIVGAKAARMAQDDLDDICIVSTRELDLAVTKIVPPSSALQERYAAMALKTAGVVIARHDVIEEGYANQPHPSPEELARRGKEAFFLDTALMELLAVGTKMRVVVHELSCDLSFVSACKALLPSFYVFLPQELMMDWKMPKPNEREAPSVDRPGAEDEAVQTMLREDKDE